MNLQRNVPLAPLTTLGVGGTADYFVRASTVDDLIEAVDAAGQLKRELFILGGGSNVLIGEDLSRYLFVHTEGLRGLTVVDEDARAVMVNVAAGEPWDVFVSHAAKRGWAGVECLSGIPGLTGATPVQNVGAYGQDVSETIARVEVLDLDDCRTKWLTNAECGFSYRWSIFKGEAKGQYAVVSVTFRLVPGGEAAVRYPELVRYLDERGGGRDLLSVRDAVIAIRKRKGMVLDAHDPDTRSDGSFFMNPILDPDEFERFRSRAEAGNAPSFPASDGKVKLSAAWLIEHAGFAKGHVHGNVGLSSKHTLALINRGDATAAEVADFVREVQGKVRDVFGVELHPEPVFVGVG